ncbi:DUF6461 domain-containing protein [Planomonospora parontospora]|uniref:DUF6461 domain-containing protein n=1 Tax=Planomonospora parontospora TaxID=58119 RepID=UPI0016705FC9|nr:DUF6461 domain-containing protein [Planomonospora parontospora]GGL50131.1 hypothetical protein GCM10014719_59240 [Planomonospora parontospora subsp. antibiotica]GII19266.1 hypothetical protein Ppa05_59920 [Planomonospora parontospora subsp. antibiotica]
MQSRTHLYDLLVSTIFTEELDAEMDLWALGFCALWIKGADLGTLAPAFHLDLATRTPCHLSEILDHHLDDGSRWVAEVNGWIGIVPTLFDDDASLMSVTQGGRQALSFSMDIHGREYFKYARDGRMIVSFEPNWPDRRFGDDPHALDHLMDGLRFQITDDDVDPVEADESVSSALALIGRITETDIATDWFQARHSRISDPSWRPPRP